MAAFKPISTSIVLIGLKAFKGVFEHVVRHPTSVVKRSSSVGQQMLARTMLERLTGALTGCREDNSGFRNNCGNVVTPISQALLSNTFIATCVSVLTICVNKLNRYTL